MTQTSPLSPGDEITLEPHDLAVSGGSIARLSGMAVFLDKGLPGETLRARVTECKPRFARATVLETLVPSPHARPSFCPFGEICGGCAWTTLAYDAELAWKERQVRETLRRIGKVDFDGDTAYLPIVPSPRQTEYRNKMEFAFGFSGDAPALGLRQRGSHEIAAIDECAVCAAPVRGILAAVREWMRETGLAPYGGASGFLRFLVVRCPDHAPDGKRRVLVECITGPGYGQAFRATAALGEHLLASSLATGFIHSVRRAPAALAYGEKTVEAFGETTVTETIGHVVLEAPVQAFLQTNTAAAALLYEQIRAYAAAENALVCDLYSGVGGIALYLAKDAAAVRGIDSVRQAVRFATKNAAIALESNALFIHGDVATELSAISPRPDVVITDPPRAGMERRLVDALLRQRPPRIVAVGCDAASLARDIALLGAAYRVTSVRAVDLFPHTPHVEVAALLETAR